jgi:eukaryotic-like serine/threonine-protein kinase
MQDFTEGRTRDVDSIAIREHLRKCSACRAVVAASSQSDEPSPRMFEGTRELWGREGALIASRYKLERRIGAGAMGVVWSAYDCHTKGPVAIKLLNLPDSAHKQRFRHECQMLASLSHANIVQVLAINAEDDSELASIIMELLCGETLAETLEQRSQLSALAVCFLAESLLLGLRHAHAAGLVHRDLKPQNIFLHKDGEQTIPKIIDFGLAKAAAEWNMSSITRSGAVLGTPRYMAPEQVFDEPGIDHRADLWALGVVLYRALSGRFPHDGHSLGEVVRAFAEGTWIPVEHYVPDVNRRLATFISHLIAREPNARPQSADAALTQLRNIIQTLSAAGSFATDEP